MASFDIKSELDHHEVTNAVDQANRVLQNRFDFKGTGAEFTMSDKEINLSAKEEFQIHQMAPVLNESLAKRGIDLKSLKPGDVEVSGSSSQQVITLQEGIDKELAKKITTMIKQSKSKVQASIQGDSVRITGKKRDELQDIIQVIKDQNYDIPLQFVNFRD
ncbi:YajQ family cyclic di-GMP-binding protein [Gammaproteobacteria bacterium]|nr:YajQ family cyclic di-GMP-binding protein [Gammaproteobacteria bacterium]MDC0591149.1 YajQ family cyclic di-GMP-binding protein [Gammaproteobacteria bacterium]|tara:strand:- start:542 stop:1024 length:483 start_codon:yes stop_codon:yes gene_type:complete